MGIHILVAHVDCDGGNARLDIVADGHGHQFAVGAACRDAVDEEAVAAFRRQNGAGGILHRDLDVAQGLGRGVGDGKAKRELAVCHDRLIAAKAVVGDHQDRIGHAAGLAFVGLLLYDDHDRIGVVYLLVVRIQVLHVDCKRRLGNIRILYRAKANGAIYLLAGLDGVYFDEAAARGNDQSGIIQHTDYYVVDILGAGVQEGHLEVEVRISLQDAVSVAIIEGIDDEERYGFVLGAFFFFADQRKINCFRSFLCFSSPYAGNLDSNGIAAGCQIRIHEDWIVHGIRLANAECSDIPGCWTALDRQPFRHSDLNLCVINDRVAAIKQCQLNKIHLTGSERIAPGNRIGNVDGRLSQRGKTVDVFHHVYVYALFP